MKICYLNHDLKAHTGCGRFCLFLIKEIKNILPQAQITVLTSELAGHSLEQPILKNKIWQVVFALSKIRRIFKECDVIHALDGWPYGVIAVLASWGLKKKIIITAIGSGAVAPLYSFWRRPIISWAYRHTSEFTAISHNTQKEILKILPKLKIKVINHGVDAEKFRHISSKIQDTRYKPYILSVGTLKRRKGYEYSIRAFAEIAPKFPELKYVIVGRGSESENLKLKIKNLKLEEKVIFLNGLNEESLLDLYRNAELFILLPQDIAKDIEGFGLVFLEAAACGLPVVSAKDTSAEDAVLDGQNGFLVPPQDFAAAGEAMAKILRDKNLRENFSRASLEFAQKMSWQKTAIEYSKLYPKLN